MESLDRNGITQEALVRIILAIVVVGIMLMLLPKILELSSKKITDASCAQSILVKQFLYNKAADATTDAIVRSAVDKSVLECESPHTDYELAAGKGDTVLYKNVAEELRKCWIKSAGKANTLARSASPKDTTYCLVCSTFTVPKKTDLVGLKYYLETAIVPNTQRTYFDVIETDAHNVDYYFLGAQSSDSDIRKQKLSTRNDDLAQAPTTYYVIAMNVYNKEYNVLATVSSLFEAHKSENFNHVFIMEESDWQKGLTCDTFFYRPVGERKVVAGSEVNS